jgi:CHAT domain-containing protein/tetratricopeptide (TPR) repeat protein
MANLACERQPRPPVIHSAADLPEAMAWALEGTCRFEPNLAPGIGGCDCRADPDPDALVPRPTCDPPPLPGSRSFERLQAIAPKLRTLAADSSASAAVAAAIWSVVWSESIDSARESRDRLLEITSQTEADAITPPLLGVQLILASRARSARELFVAQELVLKATPAARLAPVFEANRRQLEAWMQGAPKSGSGEGGLADRCPAHRRAAELHAFDGWPQAVLVGDTARASAEMEIAAEAGRTLSEDCNDAYFESLVHSARTLGAEGRLVAARAVQRFEEAKREYAHYELEASRARFGRALGDLRESLPVVALEAELFLAACEYQLGEFAAGESRARKLESADLSHLPTVAGRLHWTLGTFTAWRARPLEALDHYRRASEAYSSAGDVVGFATAEAFVAELTARFGDLEQAASLTLRGLRVADRVDDPRRRMNVYYTAALVAEAMGAVHLSRARFSDAVEAIRGAGQDIALASGLVQVARLSKRLGDTEASRAAADEAFALVPDSRTDSANRLMRADAHLALWEVSESNADAAKGLDEAEAIYSAHGIEKGIFETRLARLRLDLAGGEPFESASVERALDGLSLEFGDLDLETRARTADRREQLVDELVERAVSANDPLFALAIDQWDRSWLLAPAPRSLAALRDELVLSGADLSDVAGAIVLRQLGDRWLRWVWQRSEWRAEYLAAGVEATARKIARWRSALREGELASARREARELREILVPPVAIRGTSDVLVAVLDGEFWQAPVASWSVPEWHGDGAAPWLRVALQLRDPGGGGRRSVERRGAGFVGYPSLDESLGLAALDAERLELAAVRASFGSEVEVLTSDGASPRATSEALSSKRLLHFVTHMTAGGDAGEMAMLLLSPDAGSARVYGLTAEQLRKLNLDGLALVVLAGCSSAVGAPTSLGERASLAAALLHAGASQVIGTLWDVDDRGAASFAARFYATIGPERLSDREIEVAFRRALAASAAAGARDAGAFQLLRRYGFTATAGDRSRGPVAVDQPAHTVSLDEGGRG